MISSRLVGDGCFFNFNIGLYNMVKGCILYVHYCTILCCTVLGCIYYNRLKIVYV